jgi:hypothetical protein
MISPLQRDASESRPGILVQIKNHRGASDQFVLGGDMADRGVLEHRMKETVRTLMPKNHDEAVVAEVTETEGSGFWEQLEPSL